MNAHPAQPRLWTASLPPRAFPTETNFPWRVEPRAQAAASISPTDLAAKQWVWHSRFGTIVIEVRGNDVFVNGDRVAPHAP